MNKLSSVALSVALVVAGVGASVSAEAHPYFGIGIDVPRVAVVEPYSYAPGYDAPYYYGGGYWRGGYNRDRGEWFYRGWEHGGGRRGDRR